MSEAKIKQGWLVILNYGDYDSQVDKPIKMYLDEAVALKHCDDGNARLKVLHVHHTDVPIDTHIDIPTAIKELQIEYIGSDGCEYRIWGSIDVELPEPTISDADMRVAKSEVERAHRIMRDIKNGQYVANKESMSMQVLNSLYQACIKLKLPTD